IGTAFKQVSQEIERIQPLRAKHATYEQLAQSLRAERQNLIAELSELRSKRSSVFGAAVTKLNRRLKGKIRTFLEAEAKREPLKHFLIAYRLENVGEKRLSWIEDKEVTPLSLARAIEGGADSLTSAFGMTPGVAAALTKLPRSRLLELESLELGDHIEI